MFLSIDWLSFTFSMDNEQEVMAFELWGRAAALLKRQFPLAYGALIDKWDWTPRPGRAPYNSAQQRSDNGVMIFARQGIEHSLVEVGGIGMDALGSLELELALAQEVRDRVTRIDIAADIFTEVQPDDFAKARETGHFKAWSEAFSSSGHTCYVGSKSSDRYARVYRYFHPHPRAQFLRIEHVLKAEQARLALSTIGDIGLETFVAQLGNTFGWKHPAWSPSANTLEAASAWRPERRQGKTVAWLYSQVLPAMLKLHREGVIDLREIVQDELLGKLDE